MRDGVYYSVPLRVFFPTSGEKPTYFWLRAGTAAFPDPLIMWPRVPLTTSFVVSKATTDARVVLYAPIYRKEHAAMELQRLVQDYVVWHEVSGHSPKTIRWYCWVLHTFQP